MKRGTKKEVAKVVVRAERTRGWRERAAEEAKERSSLEDVIRERMRLRSGWRRRRKRISSVERLQWLDWMLLLHETSAMENRDDCDEELAGPAEIREACKTLVEKLPASFRDAVRSDAEKIATMSRRLCPNVPWLVLKLEICQYLRCIKWHQDYYTSRTLVTYVGPGTCAADDKDVRWDKIDVEGPNDDCVKNVKQMETNSVLLMKETWPGIQGKGLTHKSPAFKKNPPPKRLILKLISKTMSFWVPMILTRRRRRTINRLPRDVVSMRKSKCCFQAHMRSFLVQTHLEATLVVLWKEIESLVYCKKVNV